MPIPPPGHLVFDGAVALAKADADRRERKRLKRQRKRLVSQIQAKGLEVTDETLAAQSAENASNDRAGGENGEEESHDSGDSDSEDEEEEKEEEGGSGGRQKATLDSDDEDARDQARAKANDPEYQAILAELARVAAVVEGREDARPVVTPSQPHMAGLSVQEKEMLEAAKTKEKEKEATATTAPAPAPAPAIEGDDVQIEAVVPLHLRHDHNGSPSSLPHVYGHGTVIDNDAGNPGGVNSGGIDGYDNPGNLFVRTPSGTPKYAGKEGKPKTPLNSSVKLVASNEIRPTNRANILAAQQELLRSEL